MVIVINWRDVLKAKAKTQQALTIWGNQKWRTPKQHSAVAQGRTPSDKSEGRYMPEATYKKTPKSRLEYQDKKKKEGTKQGKQHVPTGKKFKQV